jgi:hypothetical protein
VFICEINGVILLFAIFSIFVAHLCNYLYFFHTLIKMTIFYCTLDRRRKFLGKKNYKMHAHLKASEKDQCLVSGRATLVVLGDVGQRFALAP